MNKKNFQHITRSFPLVLASASPRRRDLLEQVDIPFVVSPADIDESERSDNPGDNARILAEEKAQAIYGGRENGWVLGADTIVVIGSRVLGKPRDEKDAEKMLRMLSGKEHRVITGFCICSPDGKIAFSDHVSTDVDVKPLTDQEIQKYISTKEPFGKAGAYAIQGIGSFMVQGIKGSYSNVVGLPVCEVIKGLEHVGAVNGFPMNG